MKIKNVGFLELHIEKIVLGLVVVYALVIAWLFMLGNPYKAKIQGEPAAQSPVEVEQMLLKEAKSIERLVAPDSKSHLPKMPVPDYYGRFAQRIGAPAINQAQLAFSLGAPGLDISISGPNVMDIDPVPPPAPTDVKVATHHAVMDRYPDAKVDAEFVKLVNAKQGAPRDFRYVSFSAKFSQSAWKDRVTKYWDPKLSRGHWTKLQVILDVLLERQVFDPVTGQWGVYRDDKFVPGQIEGPGGQMGAMVDGRFIPGHAEVDVLPAFPDSVSYRQYIARKEWPEDIGEWAVELEKHARQYGSQLTENRFPPVTDASPRRIEPGEDLKDWESADIDRLYELNIEIDKIERQLRQIGGDEALMNLDYTQLLREEEEEKAPTRGRPSFRTRPSTSESGGEFVRPGGKTTPRPRTTAKDGKNKKEAQIQARIKFLRKKLLELMRERALIRAKYAPEGEDLDPKTGAPRKGGIDDKFGFGKQPGSRPGGRDYDEVRPGARRPTLRPGQTPDPAEPVELPDVNIELHDLTVRPGATYRYRVRVAVLNPLFRVQKGLAKILIEQNVNELAKISEPSEWSQQVKVMPENHFFVVSANGDKQDSAKVEIWHLFNGRWYQSQFEVQPGQLIGGKTTIQFASGGGTADNVSSSEVELNVPMIMIGLEEAPTADGGTLGKQKKTFLYLDLETNLLMDRDPAQDKNDQIRKQLLNQSNRVAE